MAALGWFGAVSVIAGLGALVRQRRRKATAPSNQMGQTLMHVSHNPIVGTEILGAAWAGLEPARPWRRGCPSWQRLKIAWRVAFQPFRILITYVQITSSLGSVMQIQYPDYGATPVWTGCLQPVV